MSGEKVLGFLGNRLINVGNFDVGIEAQMLFTSREIISAIRGNETVTMDFVIKNTDGIIVGDLPSMTLGGGGRDYPLNESVLVNITAEAFQDDAFGTSVGISLIPVPLP